MDQDFTALINVFYKIPMTAPHFKVVIRDIQNRKNQGIQLTRRLSRRSGLLDLCRNVICDLLGMGDLAVRLEGISLPK